MLSGGVSGGVRGPTAIWRWTAGFDGCGDEERFDDWDDVGVSGVEIAVVMIRSMESGGPTLSGGVRLSVVMLGRIRCDGGVAYEFAISTSIVGNGPEDELLYEYDGEWGVPSGEGGIPAGGAHAELETPTNGAGEGVRMLRIVARLLGL